jgi:UDP-glucose 4-epimerase
VIILDDLSLGHRAAVTGGELIQGDLGDIELLGGIFQKHQVSCVMHFAAFALVPESMADPLAYYDNNTAKTTRLLMAMRDHGVKSFILSSTCAVYGQPKKTPITEETPTEPINPYGRSKLMVERILADCAAAFGLKYTSFRYFNAAGANEKGDIGEDHDPETHLIPLVLKTALGQRGPIKIYGTDYDTPDGTCLRDYIHVDDLALAHFQAAERMLDGGPGGIYNLGTETGLSVREVVDLARKVTGATIESLEAERRPGDPARLVGSAGKARRELGWRPVYDDPERIVASAWKWHRAHPRGYED